MAPNVITNVTVESLIYKLQDESLSDAAKRIFFIGIIFDSKEVLHRACLLFGSEWGFHFQSNSRKMCCNRNAAYVAKTDVIPKEKLRNHLNSIKVGCNFHIKYKKLHAGAQVQVNNGCYEHSADLGCNPSATNLVIVKKASGHYSKIEPPAMNHFLEMLQHGSLTPKIMRNLFKSLLPSNVPITGQFIVNMRMKAAKYLPQWIASGRVSMKDYNDMTMYTGLDNIPEFHHDKATVMATQVMEEILNEGEFPSTITTYLSRLNAVDSSFKYRLAKDEESNTLIGVIWQNATMRSMFEDYGDVLFTDVMKRQTNSIRWPYISFTVLDGMKRTHVVVEGIVCGEYVFAYKWVLKSLLEMTPKKDKNSISTIFADQFLNESVMDGLGFLTNPLLGTDYFHMLDSILPQQFSRMTFNTVKTDLVNLLNADSEEDFNTHLQSLKGMLGHNQSHLRKLDQLSLSRKKFAKYELFNHKGSLQRRGTAPAEGNHASYLAVIGRLLSHDPILAISKMIEREKDLVNAKNVLLAQYKQTTIVTQSCGSNVIDVIERDGKQFLSSWGFRLFQKELILSNDYFSDTVIDGSITCVKVQKKDPKCESFRLIVCGNRCPCPTVISLGIMCRHEIVSLQCFKPDYFISRWNIVEFVRLSEDSSSSVPSNGVENIIDARSNMFHTESTTDCYAQPDSRQTQPTLANTNSVQLSLPKSHNTSVQHVDFKNVADNLFGLCQHNQLIRTAVYNVLCGLQRTLVTENTGSTNDVLSSLNEGYKMYTTIVPTNVANLDMPKDPVPFKSDRNTPQKRIKSPGERVASLKRHFSSVELVADAEPIGVSKRQRSNNTTTKTARQNFNVASTSECHDTITYKKVAKGVRSCSFCHVPRHKNQDTSPCPLLSHHGVKLDKKSVDILMECQKEVFIVSNQGTPMTVIDTVLTNHVVIHSFVVFSVSEVTSCNILSTNHVISDILALVTLLDKCVAPVKDCHCILLTINCLMKWVMGSKKFSLLIDGRHKWKHRSLQEAAPKASGLILEKHLPQTSSYRVPTINVDINSFSQRMAMKTDGVVELNPCNIFSDFDSDDELLARVQTLQRNKSSNVLEIEEFPDNLLSDNESYKYQSYNSDEDSERSYLKRVKAIQGRRLNLSNIDELCDTSSVTDEYYSDEEEYDIVKPYIYIYENLNDLVKDTVLLTRKQGGLKTISAVPTAPITFRKSNNTTAQPTNASMNCSSMESPTQLCVFSSSTRSNETLQASLLSSWGDPIQKDMESVNILSGVIDLSICWCDLRNPEKQNLLDDGFKHLVIHTFFRDVRQDKSMNQLFNDKLCIVTMLNDDGSNIKDYSFVVVRLETIAGWMDHHTSKNELLIDGLDVVVDWSKIRYFSQPQPRCVKSIFSFVLEDYSTIETVSVLDYIAMLHVQLDELDTYDKDLRWSDRMTIIIPTNVIDVAISPRAQISPGDMLLYSYKGMFYDTTTLLQSKVMIIDESPPLNYSHLFIKLQNGEYLTKDDIVMKVNPKTNEAMSTWLSLGMINVREWQECDVIGGKVVSKSTHLMRKAHRSFVRGCQGKKITKQLP